MSLSTTFSHVVMVSRYHQSHIGTGETSPRALSVIAGSHMDIYTF